MSLKNTQWNRSAPVILHSPAHSSLRLSIPTPAGQLTFQCDGPLPALECDISSHHSLYRAKCAVLQIRARTVRKNVKMGVVWREDEMDVRASRGADRAMEREIKRKC